MRINFKVAQTCPSCRSQNIMITDVCVMFDDTRMETVCCCDCSTEWKLYYKVADCFAEVLPKHECKCKNDGSECKCENEGETEPKLGVLVNKNTPSRGVPHGGMPNAPHTHSAACNHAAITNIPGHVCTKHTDVTD